MNDQERIEYFKEQIARLSNQVVDLQNERDGLSAKLQKIDDAWMAAGCWPTTVEEKQALANAINTSPQQCLAEIRAEAGRAGYVSGYEKCWREVFGTKPSADSVDEYADSYANRLRQGGE